MVNSNCQYSAISLSGVQGCYRVCTPIQFLPFHNNNLTILVPISFMNRTYLTMEILNTMLELRPTCENCGKLLLPNSTEAMICTYECTFCRDCVENVLSNVCPNCGGGFERRPVRPH